MFELVYNSIASTSLKGDDLLVIQILSADANSKTDITGFLFYRGNQFVGILEGNEENVKGLFSKIEKSNKHKNVSILAEGPIKERQFDQWNMISAKGVEDGMAAPEDGLMVKNILGLAQLSEKRTYGSRVFWYTVKKILRETAQQQAIHVEC